METKSSKKKSANTSFSGGITEGNSSAVDALERMGTLAKIGIWEYHPQDSKMFWSREVYKILGVTDSIELTLSRFLEFYPDESAGIIHRAIELAIEEGKPFIRDCEISAASGKRKWIRTQGEVIQNEKTKAKRIFGTIQDISEIRLLDRITQETALTLSQVEQISHIGHWSVNIVDGSFYHSDEIKRIFGYEPSEYALSVEEAINAYHPDDREDVIKYFNRAVETGEGYEFDLRVIQPSGDIRQVHSKGYTQKNDDGKVIRVYGVFQDLTEVKQSLQFVEKSKMLLSASLESQKDTILLSIDQNYCYLFFNKTHADTMKHVYGKDVQIGMNILECITSDEDRQAAKSNYERALRGESHSNIMVYGDDNMKAWFESFFNPILNDKNEIIGATAMARDITERKKSEDALRASEERYRLINNASFDQIYSYDQDNRFTSANRQLCENLGLSANEIIGKTYWELGFPEAQCLEWDELHRQVYSKGSVVQIVSTPMPDGTDHYFEVNLSVVKDDSGEIIGIAGVNRDITERKHAEQALLESRNRYYALFEQAGDGIFTLDSSGRIISVNETFAQMHGYSEDEIKKMSLQELDVEGNAKTPERILRIMAGETLSFEVEHYHKDRHTFPLMVTANLIEVGTEQFIIAIHRDLTERKRMEAALHNVQKLESLGVLAGGIAHDFNNLLTGIMGNLSIIAAEKESSERQRLVNEAIEATKRAAGLTRKLLAFAKGGIPERKMCSVSDVIRASAEFSLGHNSLCHCDMVFPPNLWRANIDPEQISQVIQNLIINAKQAMPGGGVIQIRTENIELPATNKDNLSAGPYILISVQDTGIGIPGKYLEKIFEPYFSTKNSTGEEGGSGLGLAIAYSVMKNHKGNIKVTSKQGEGSTFYILLPAVKQDVVEEQIETEKNSHLSSSLNVLVMDDEDMIRFLLKTMLEKLGHRVELAEQGEEALSKYRTALQSAEPFDLVILDLTIPGGMGGTETLKKLQEIREDVIAVISSGYSSSCPEGFHGVLPKPYPMNSLRTVIDSIFQL